MAEDCDTGKRSTTGFLKRQSPQEGTIPVQSSAQRAFDNSNCPLLRIAHHGTIHRSLSLSARCSHVIHRVAGVLQSVLTSLQISTTRRGARVAGQIPALYHFATMGCECEPCVTTAQSLRERKERCAGGDGPTEHYEIQYTQTPQSVIFPGCSRKRHRPKRKHQRLQEVHHTGL